MGLSRAQSTRADTPDRLRPLPGVGPVVKFPKNRDRNFVPNFPLVDTGPTPLLVLCERSPMSDEHRATSVDGEEKNTTKAAAAQKSNSSREESRRAF